MFPFLKLVFILWLAFFVTIFKQHVLETSSNSEMQVGSTGLIIIAIVYIGICLILANYGKSTKLGFWGSLAIVIFLTPSFGGMILQTLKNAELHKKKTNHSA